jgi:putative serine protease PepD
MTGPDLIASDPRTKAPVRTGRTTAMVAVAVVAVAALVLTAIVSFGWGSAGAPRPSPAAAPTSPAPSKEPTTAEIYRAVAPSVVSIEAGSAGTATTDSGTGVIVNADGTILTALHVVKGATAIHVTFADGTRSGATVAAADPATDIALLGPATLPSVVVPAVLGRTDRLAVGDSVIAVGNQFGLTRTTTTGVVSGLNHGVVRRRRSLLVAVAVGLSQSWNRSGPAVRRAADDR